MAGDSETAPLRAFLHSALVLPSVTIPFSYSAAAQERIHFISPQ